MDVKIIADGLALEALKEVLGGQKLAVEEPSTQLKTGDVLVIYAHALAMDDRQQSTVGGLEALDRLLADPEVNLPAILILSFLTQAQHLLRGFRSSLSTSAEPTEEVQDLRLKRAARSRNASILTTPSLLPFGRLPVDQDGLQQLIKVGCGSRLDPCQEWLLRLQASRRLLAARNEAYRHEHKNLIAAVRIYLGALQAGAASLEQAEQVLEQLACKEKRFPGVPAPAVEAREMSNLCHQHRKLVERVSTTLPSHPFDAMIEPWHTWVTDYRKQQGEGRPIRRDRQILMLDDQCDDSGWVDVLEALAEDRESVTAVSNWNAARTCLSDTKFDLMLIDCNLGSDRATGLELLRPLRQFSVDLPITMMTAYDDAELALWALRSGANDFYAKSLGDDTDRDSLDYYLRFAEVIGRPRWEKELRECWAGFETALPLAQGHYDEKSRLRYAFYLLFSLTDGTAWWARSGMALAAEADARDWICRTTVLSIATAFIPAHYTTEHLIWVKARHPGRADPVTVGDALAMLRFGERTLCALSAGRARATDSCASLSTSPDWPPGCRIAKAHLLSEDPSRPSGDGQDRVKLGHLQRSSLGAVQFLLGCLAGAGSIQEQELDAVFGDDYASALTLLQETYPSAFQPPKLNGRPGVVLIDDEGKQNGWPDSLSRGLGEQVGWYPSLDEFLGRSKRLEYTEVVLLDLWLVESPGGEPTPEAGLAALRELKARDPGLPVIVLSAATDAVNAIRSMKLGALDYIPKWLPEETSPLAWEAFSEGLKTRISAASTLGRSKLRRAWKSLADGLQASPDSGPMGGPPNSSEPLPENWFHLVSRAFLEHILPALVLYNTWLTGRLLNGQMPSLDAWRVTRVLVTHGSVAEDIALLAGRAAEYLGWANFCLNRNEIVSHDEWKTMPQYRPWIQAASPSANTLWNHRNWVKDPLTSTRPAGWHPDPEITIDLSLRCLGEFEERVMNGLVHVS